MKGFNVFIKFFGTLILFNIILYSAYCLVEAIKINDVIYMALDYSNIMISLYLIKWAYKGIIKEIKKQ